MNITINEEERRVLKLAIGSLFDRMLHLGVKRIDIKDIKALDSLAGKVVTDQEVLEAEREKAEIN